MTSIAAASSTVEVLKERAKDDIVCIKKSLKDHDKTVGAIKKLTQDDKSMKASSSTAKDGDDDNEWTDMSDDDFDEDKFREAVKVDETVNHC